MLLVHLVYMQIYKYSNLTGFLIYEYMANNNSSFISVTHTKVKTAGNAE